MANELKLSFSLSFSKGGVVVRRSYSDTIDVAGNVAVQSVQSIGTSEEALTIPSDLATVGYAFIHNMDATNYVNIGPATARTDFKLLAGEAAMFRLDSGSTIYVKANTASCDVEFILIEL